MKIISLQELIGRAQLIEKAASSLVETLLEPNILIADIPAPEKKTRKKYIRKAKKVDPILEEKEDPKPKVRKPRAKKNPFYPDEDPVTGEV